MTIIEQIRKELFELNQKYIDEADDNYDFWNNHIKYVVSEAVNLAKTHNAEIGDVIICVLREKDKFTTNTNGNFIKTGEKEIYIKCYKKEENYA